MMILRVTEEVLGLMCVSEFMFRLSLEINVSEWLETGPQRLNPDGCVSTGEDDADGTVFMY